jgi:hypothetical protein
MSFSAHADARGIMQMIRTTTPRSVVLVHGEAAKMAVLKNQIVNEMGIPCFDPPNGTLIHLPSSMEIPFYCKSVSSLVDRIRSGIASLASAWVKSSHSKDLDSLIQSSFVNAISCDEKDGKDSFELCKFNSLKWTARLRGSESILLEQDQVSLEWSNYPATLELVDHFSCKEKIHGQKDVDSNNTNNYSASNLNSHHFCIKIKVDSAKDWISKSAALLTTVSPAIPMRLENFNLDNNLVDLQLEDVLSVSASENGKVVNIKCPYFRAPLLKGILEILSSHNY